MNCCTNLSSPISQFYDCVDYRQQFYGGYFHDRLPAKYPRWRPITCNTITGGMFKAFVMLLIPVGIISGLFVLARNTSRNAITELESPHPTVDVHEISAHENLLKLEQAKKSAERPITRKAATWQGWMNYAHR